MLIVSEYIHGHNGAIDVLVFHQKDSFLHIIMIWRILLRNPIDAPFNRNFQKIEAFFHAGL